jgi:hypothetical protein
MAKKSDSKLKKHLPKRCINARAKERRIASHARGARRKAERNAAALVRHKANAEVGHTKWEAACAARAVRRAS